MPARLIGRESGSVVLILGLVSVGLVALDGSLIAANASQGATRSQDLLEGVGEGLLVAGAEAGDRGVVGDLIGGEDTEGEVVLG